MPKFALVLAAVAAFAWMPRAAAANDTLHVVAGFAGGIEVLENVAKYGGLFAAEHLDVDKQYSNSAANCAQLAGSGKADVCATSIEPTILGYDKGLRLVIFFSRVATYEYLLAVPADSPIKTLAGFKGAEIGEPGPGSAVEVAANDMLQGAGLRKSDYTYDPVGAGAQALAALVAHKVAGLADSATALGTEGAVSHLTFRYFKDPILDSIPNAGFGARPDVIATKGDLLRRYARAIVKAAILIRENPAVAARYALMGESVGAAITPAALQTAKDELIGLQGHLIAADPMNPRIGATPLAGIDLYSRLLYDDGLARTIVPASAIVTNQFIAFANGFDRKAWIAAVKRMR
jgi:ABC-type nitrate/sulfonate/bicarbonate transport system substrate-binding protein